MADPAYIRNLRAITRAEPQFTHIEALEKELHSSDNERAAVVVFGSFVKTHLERLVTSKIRSGLGSTDRRRLFEGDGPLSTFSSKILAYAFKIIGPITRFDLDLLRVLRNECAHSRIPVDFRTP